jgi:hypothetical protein
MNENVPNGAKKIASLVASSIFLAIFFSHFFVAMNPLMTSGPFYGVYDGLKSITGFESTIH